MAYIYALVDPRTDEIRYIGYTTAELEKRVYAHFVARKQRDTHKDRWLRILWNEHQLRPKGMIIEEITEDQWLDREQYWIAEYRNRGARLTNILAGGEGVRKGTKLTEEHKRKMSESMKGKNTGPKLWLRGKPAWNSGKGGYKLSVSRKGNPNYFGKIGLKGADNRRSKIFYLRSPDGEILEFTGVRAFAREHDLASASNVSALLKGKLGQYKGWTLPSPPV